MKKQIDFDFTKWGQEGVSVECYKEEILSLHINPKSSNYYYGMVNGTTCFNVTKSYLTMYEEVKPREFWVIMYGNKSSRLFYDTKEQAQKYLVGGGIIIKVVEVIE
jgi:hypothetical protein